MVQKTHLPGTFKTTDIQPVRLRLLGLGWLVPSLIPSSAGCLVLHVAAGRAAAASVPLTARRAVLLTRQPRLECEDGTSAGWLHPSQRIAAEQAERYLEGYGTSEINQAEISTN